MGNLKHTRNTLRRVQLAGHRGSTTESVLSKHRVPCSLLGVLPVTSGDVQTGEERFSHCVQFTVFLCVCVGVKLLDPRSDGSEGRGRGIHRKTHTYTLTYTHQGKQKRNKNKETLNSGVEAC